MIRKARCVRRHLRVHRTGNVTLRGGAQSGRPAAAGHLRASGAADGDQRKCDPGSAERGTATLGEAMVKLVGDDGKVVERVVQLGDAIKDQWVVTGGLKAGEAGSSKVAAKCPPGRR